MGAEIGPQRNDTSQFKTAMRPCLKMLANFDSGRAFPLAHKVVCFTQALVYKILNVGIESQFHFGALYQNVSDW